jgi:uncharacterized damage-inducible protein DinB
LTPVRGPDEPPKSLADARELLDAYLDYYRDAVMRKINGLSEQDLRSSRLPSGWTPLELLVHLTWVERRWFRWDFAGERFAQPWGDRGPDGAWQVPDSVSTDTIKASFIAQCEQSRQTAAGASLTERAQPGGRFATAAEAPTLAWILFHVLQEYARHAGHLDIARELIDGTIGE